MLSARIQYTLTGGSMEESGLSEPSHRFETQFLQYTVVEVLEPRGYRSVGGV